MNKRFALSLKQLSLPSLALLAALAVFAPGAAQATPYVVKLTQQGNNVVAVGNGEFNVNGLIEFSENNPSPGSELTPNEGDVEIGDYSLTNWYTGPSGPRSFGSKFTSPATAESGDFVGLNGNAFAGQTLYLPRSYVSGTLLSNSATWDNATFASLGVTPGTYVWTWGMAADQSFTLMIPGAVAVPEPAALGLFGLGVLLIGGFATLRRRGQRQA